MEKNRLIWACRRGMLELDILLSRFVEEHYDLLSEDEKLRFDVLLECEDQDLYNWLVKKQTPQSASINSILDFHMVTTMHIKSSNAQLQKALS